MKIAFALVLGLVGCATSGRYDKDRQAPGYHTGEYGRPFSKQNPGQPGAGGDLSSAVVALAAGGVATAVNPEYYKDSRIRGRCSCHAPKAENVSLNCPRATVILIDAKGQEVARQQSGDGEFAFDVDRKGSYRLVADVPGHVLKSAGKPLNAKSGDLIVLEFLRK